MSRIPVTVVLLIVLSSVSYALSKADKVEAQSNEAAQVALWEENLKSNQGKPDEAKLSELWLGLRNMGYRKSYPAHSHAVDDIYKKLQSELLSIPGHAEFYAKPIWESYAAYRDPDHPKHTGSLTWFSREIQIGMEILKHLPSPETVKVLGGMLGEEWEHEPRPNSKVDSAQSVAKYAVTAMTQLNLRDAPSAEIEQYSAPEVLADWQAWYEQIKTGQRTFSFKGQAVEHRFKPDGTWETISLANPPDDASESPETRSAAGRPVTQKAKDQPPGNADKAFLPYLLAALAGLLALASWFGLQRNNAGK